MIDLSTEQAITMAEAADHLPRRRPGRKVHVNTIYRWARNGLRGVRLETILVGGTMFTSVEAIQRFCERLTVVADGGHSLPRQSSASRRKRIERLEKELDEAGI